MHAQCSIFPFRNHPIPETSFSQSVIPELNNIKLPKENQLALIVHLCAANKTNYLTNSQREGIAKKHGITIISLKYIHDQLRILNTKFEKAKHYNYLIEILRELNEIKSDDPIINHLSKFQKYLVYGFNEKLVIRSKQIQYVSAQILLTVIRENIEDLKTILNLKKKVMYCLKEIFKSKLLPKNSSLSEKMQLELIRRICTESKNDTFYAEVKKLLAAQYGISVERLNNIHNDLMKSNTQFEKAKHYSFLIEILTKTKECKRKTPQRLQNYLVYGFNEKLLIRSNIIQFITKEILFDFINKNLDELKAELNLDQTFINILFTSPKVIFPRNLNFVFPIQILKECNEQAHDEQTNDEILISDEDPAFSPSNPLYQTKAEEPLLTFELVDWFNHFKYIFENPDFLDLETQFPNHLMSRDQAT